MMSNNIYKSNTMMSNEIHPAFLRDSEKKKLRKDLPGPDAQVWIYTEPGVERKLATVVDPKMIDSRILASITIPSDSLFTARFNKDPIEERRLREWPDDSQYSPDEYVSVRNDKKWQLYYTEPKSCVEVWGGIFPSPGHQVWIYTKPGEKKLATVVDPKMINSRVLYSITIPPNALFTAWINDISNYVSVLKDEKWEWYDHPPQSGPPPGSAGSMPSCWGKPAKKIVDLKETIQKEVYKQLENNGHLERIKFQNEMIKKQKKEIKVLKEMMAVERKSMQYEIDDAEQEIDDLKEKNKEMMGKIVKVQWVIDKIKDVNGYTETGAEIAETFEYIDFSEVEKEEFVASSITNSVNPATLQEDREFYGEDFNEETTPRTDVDSSTSSIEELTPREEFPLLLRPTGVEDEDMRQSTSQGEDLTVNGNYDLTTVTPGRHIRGRSQSRSPEPNSRRRNLSELFDHVVNRRELFLLSAQPEYVPWQGFNVVDRYEDTSVIPDGPNLPWYEARFPTIMEIEAARVIQHYYRTNVIS